MSMRMTVYEILAAATDLTDIVGDRILERGSAIDIPTRPFLVQAWGVTAISNTTIRSARFLDLYVHDERGDYGRIEEALAAAKLALKGVAQYVGTTGYRIVQCDYQGISGDLDDPDRRTNFQFSSWQVVGGEET